MNAFVGGERRSRIDCRLPSSLSKVLWLCAKVLLSSPPRNLLTRNNVSASSGSSLKPTVWSLLLAITALLLLLLQLDEEAFPSLIPTPLNDMALHAGRTKGQGW